MEQNTATEQNKRIVREFVEEVINKGRIESAGRYMTEDVEEQVPLPGQGPGLQGVKDLIAGLRAGFAELHFAIEEQVAEADKVVTRFTWTGTHRGPFLGIPATGRAVSVWGMVIDRLRDGKIFQTRIIMDVAGLLGQVGVLPPPG